jgi:hypothetical protein
MSAHWHRVGAVSARTRTDFADRLTPWVGEVGSSQTEGPNVALREFA